MLLPIRIVLEKFAFRHAAKKLTGDDYLQLEKLIADMRRAGDTADRSTIVEADIRFHEYVITRCGWPDCERNWRGIVARVRAYFWTDAPLHPSPHDIADQHQVLLDALRGSDEETLASAVIEHIQHRP
jgi:DNA-binding GntR family transcriptional regulator